MNPRIIKTVILSTSLALPAGLYAQSQSPRSPSTDPNRPSAGQSQQQPAVSPSESQQHHRYGSESAEIKRISSDKLDKKVTAKSLLDKDVYDQEGNRVGQITDFALGNVLPAQLAQKMERDMDEAGVMERDIDADRPTSGASVGVRSSASQSATSSSAGQVGQSQRTTETAQAGQSSTRPGEPRQGSIAGTSTLGSEMHRDQELTLFVRVGGALGMGGDTVAIPASALDYDSEEDRFTVAKSSAEIAAIAEGKDDEVQGAAKQRFED